MAQRARHLAIVWTRRVTVPPKTALVPGRFARAPAINAEHFERIECLRESS